ncbi:AAA family ATPase [Pseudomonas corrugata]|uniref:AAA family ATPase n=1 Tax=Pseudomonas corrugata TaxID=47879 RepID=A0A7Y5Z2N0_9PSED|nr:AAA family ATPase [Pseudomonas corrugata]NUT85940.1 AAA family ATPase [Pseudomonas corrugata]
MKFEKVTIDGFRAYRSGEDGSFDFILDDGVCANFISIYAPNGFGKTSFYDAVEWALTNNINRYLLSSNQKNNIELAKGNNVSGQRQSILRNKYVPDDYKAKVIVEVTSTKEDTKVFENLVKKARIGQADYKFDKKESFPGSEPFSEIFLSQDAIDAFLKEDHPATRYEKFMESFGGEDEAYRSSLFAVRKQLNDNILKLQEIESELNIVISQPINNDLLEVINSAIDAVNVPDRYINNIGSTYSESVEIELRSQVSKRKTMLVSELNILNEKNSAAAKAIISVPRFSELNATRTTQTIAEERYKAALDILNEIDIRRTSLNGNRKSLAEITEKIREHKRHLSNLDEYQAILIEFVANQRAVNTSSAAKAQAEETLFRVKQEIEVAENNLSDAEKKISDLNRLEIESPMYYVKIERARQILAGIELSLDLLGNDLIEAKSKYEESKQNLLWLKTFDILEIYKEPFKLKGIAIDEDSIVEFDSLLEKRETTQHDLNELQEKKNQFALDASLLSELASAGLNLLDKTHSDTCPLCHIKHDSYQKLHDRIINNEFLSAIEKQHLTLESELQSELAGLNSEIETLFKFFSARLQLLKEQAEQTHYKESVIVTEVEYKIEAKQTELKTIIEQEATDHNSVYNMSPTDLSTYINSQRVQLVGRRAQVESSLKQSRNNYFSLQDELSNRTAEVDNLTHESEKIKTRPLLVELGNHIRDYNKNPSDVKLALEQITDTLNAKSNSLVADQEQILKLLAIAENTQEIDFVGMDRQAITAQIDILRAALQNTEVEWISFLSDIKPFLSIDQKSINIPAITLALEEVTAALNNKIAETINLFATIESLATQLDELAPFFKHQEAKQKLHELRADLGLHQTLTAKLDNEYDQVADNLRLHIDSFFFPKLINKIYSKIDPHPEFNSVRFDCKFPRYENPRFEIYVQDNNNDSISPNFYFSAAQLNVLSLSIFLAKALHAKYKGEPIDSIFIDDPIHSMDSINILSTIDLLRTLSYKFGKQLIMSTHDENFHRLLQKKIPTDLYGSKFIEFETYGKIAG